MKKTLISTFIFCASCLGIARADNLYSFIAMRCIPELNYFEASPVWVSNDGSDIENAKAKSNLIRNYSLFQEEIGSGKFTCELDNEVIEVTYRTDSLEGAGMCGSGSKTTISVSLNDDLLMRDVLFNDGCFSASLTRVVYQNSDLLLSMHAARGQSERVGVFNESVFVGSNNFKAPITQEYIETRSSELQNKYVESHPKPADKRN